MESCFALNIIAVLIGFTSQNNHQDCSLKCSDGKTSVVECSENHIYETLGLLSLTYQHTTYNQFSLNLQQN